MLVVALGLSYLHLWPGALAMVTYASTESAKLKITLAGGASDLFHPYRRSLRALADWPACHARWPNSTSLSRLSCDRASRRQLDLPPRSPGCFCCSDDSLAFTKMPLYDVNI